MFWDKIIRTLSEYGIVMKWSIDEWVISSHDNICGLRAVNEDGKSVSVISHKYSLGGNEDLFEIAPSAYDSEDVDGYLTEEEVIKEINSICGKR